MRRVPVSRTAQQVGMPPPVMRVRVLCCGKAGRFLLAPRDTKSGSSRPSPSRNPRSAAPRKDRTSPFSPHCGFAELSSLGGPPFLHGDQFILDSILLSKDKCILSLPNTFSISGWKHQRIIHEFNCKLCVVVARGVSIGKNRITASQLNVFHLCLWRQPPPPNRRKKIKKKKKNQVVGSSGVWKVVPSR